MFSPQQVTYLKKTQEEKLSLNPNSRKQYNFLIRENVKEALDHFNLLLSFHSEDQLKKIFSDENHELSELIKSINKRLMPPEYFKAHEELKQEFFYSPESLQIQLRNLKGGLKEQESRSQSLRQFVEEQGLKEEYTSKELQRTRAEQVTRMKKLGLTDERIDGMHDQHWEAKMRDSIWGDKKAKGSEIDEK